MIPSDSCRNPSYKRIRWNSLCHNCIRSLSPISIFHYGNMKTAWQIGHCSVFSLVAITLMQALCLLGYCRDTAEIGGFNGSQTFAPGFIPSFHDVGAQTTKRIRSGGKLSLLPLIGCSVYTVQATIIVKLFFSNLRNTDTQ